MRNPLLDPGLEVGNQRRRDCGITRRFRQQSDGCQKMGVPEDFRRVGAPFAASRIRRMTQDDFLNRLEDILGVDQKSTSGSGIPFWRQHATNALRSRHAIVIGPTPPGTGVIAPATAAAPS